MFGSPIIDPDDPDVRRMRAARRRRLGAAAIGVAVTCGLWLAVALLMYFIGWWPRRDSSLLALTLGPPILGATLYHRLQRGE